MLDVDTVERYDNIVFNNLSRVGVHGDGTCLIHSYLYLTNAKYRNLNRANKKIEGQRFRRSLAQMLLDIVEDRQSNGTDKRIKRFLKEKVEPVVVFDGEDGYSSLSEYILKELGQPHVYLGYEFVSILEMLYDINIFFFVEDKLYARERSSSIYSKNRPSLLIYNIRGLHFEPLISRSKHNKYKFVIEPDSIAVDKLVNAYKRMIRSKLATNELQKSSASPSPSPEHSSVQELPVSSSQSSSQSSSPSSSPSSLPSSSPSSSLSSSPPPKSSISKSSPEEYLETNEARKKNLTDVQSDSKSVEQDINSDSTIPSPDYTISSNIELAKEVDQIPEKNTTSDGFDEIDGIYVFKDDIQFENINDLDEIMISRIDKQQVIQYTPDQYVQEINKLMKINFTDRKTSLTTQKSVQNLASLLQIDRYVSTKNKSLMNSLTPIVNAHKQFTVDEQDMDNFDDAAQEMDTEKSILAHLDEQTTLRKQPVDKYISQISKHKKFLFAVNGYSFIDYKTNSSIIRVCPTVLDTKSTESLTNTCKLFEQGSKDELFLSKKNFLEFYQDSATDQLKITGILFSPSLRNQKFSSTPYKVFSFSKYLHFLRSVTINQEVDVTFKKHTDKQRREKAVVTKKGSNIITLEFRNLVSYKGAPIREGYFYLDPDNARHNWFLIDFTGLDFANKNTDTMFLFEEHEWNMFEALILPDTEEIFKLAITNDTILNLNTLYLSMNEHTSYTLDDISPSFHMKLKKIMHRNIDKYVKNISENTTADFAWNALSQSVDHRALSKYVNQLFFLNTNLDVNIASSLPKYLNKLLKKVDNSFNKIFVLESISRSHMLPLNIVSQYFQIMEFHTIPEKVLDNVKIELNTLDKENTSISEKLNGKTIQNIPTFFDSVEEFYNAKQHIVNKKRLTQFPKLISWLKRISANRYKPGAINQFYNACLQHYRSNYKPQNYANKSFIQEVNKKLNMTSEEYFGNKNTTVAQYQPENAHGAYFNEQVEQNIQEDADERNNNTRDNDIIRSIVERVGIMNNENMLIDYINENINSDFNTLYSHRKALFKKKNPTLKDFKKMFKNDVEKAQYVEYTRVSIICSYILIFTQVQSIELNASNEKHATMYLASIMKDDFPFNKNLNDVNRNVEKLNQTVQLILKNKPSVKTQFERNKNKNFENQPRATKSKKQFVVNDLKSIKPNAKVTFDDDLHQTQCASLHCRPNIDNVLQLLKCSESPSFPMETIKKKQNSNTNICSESLQNEPTRKTKTFYEDIELFVQTNSKFKHIFNDLLTQQFNKASWRNLELTVDKMYNEIYLFLRNHLQSDYQTDVHVLFNEYILKYLIIWNNNNNIDTESVNKILYSLLTNKSFVMLSKIVYSFNKDEHIDLLNSTTVLSRKSKAMNTDKIFISITAEKNYGSDSNTHNQIVSAILNSKLHNKFSKQLCLPKKLYMLMRFNCTDTDKEENEVRQSRLCLLAVLFSYILELFNIAFPDEDMTDVTINNDDVGLFATIVYESLVDLKSLIHSHNSLNNGEELLEAFHSIRERNKKTKFEFKDKLDDETRMLMMDFEKHDLQKQFDMTGFQSAFNAVPNQEENPEYEEYNGENADD